MAVKLTPVWGVSANEKPAKTLMASTPGVVDSSWRASASSDRIGSKAVPVPGGGQRTGG